MDIMKIYDEKFTDLIRKGVQIVNLDDVNSEVAEDKPSIDVKKEEWATNSASNLTCSYCRIEFADVQQQREHYKLDWHRYNLKQQLLSREPISEESFNGKTDDISSISGSDSEKEDSLDYIATQQGKLFLKGQNEQVFSLHRCLLFEKKGNTTESDILLERLKDVRRNNLWTILMLGGGHFAGAVFKGGEPILHKTFHCYTVRAGQGGSQGSRDNKSGGTQPKSAGASLRRYNEQALVQHVKEILLAWKDEIAKSDLIVYRAAGPYNKAVLFGGKPSVLDRNDTRLRTVPFCTRRATFAEVKRVHSLLTDVQTFNSLDEAQRRFAQQTSPDRDTKRTKTKSSSINRAKSRETTQRPLPVEISSTDSEKENERNVDVSINDTEISFKDTLQSFDDSLSPEERKSTKPKRKPKKSKNKKLKEQEEKRKTDLCNAVKEGNIDYIKTTLNTLAESEKAKFMSQPLDDDNNTVLHLAAIHNQDDLIEWLLEEDFDVCVKNKKQQTPYTVTQSKETREIFKAFAQKHPERHNYNKANIPVVTATPEELAEKKRQQRKAKREKEKAKKVELQIREAEQAEKERFLKLSDREKRALAAERRILGQSGTVTARCFLCAVDISGKVPFEYLGNRFCTVECLKAHRMQNPIKLS